MLASTPASILNQKTPASGIPNSTESALSDHALMMRVHLAAADGAEHLPWTSLNADIPALLRGQAG